MHEKERAYLEQQLDHCRNQISLQLTFLSETSLQALVQAASDDAAKFKRLRNSVENLRHGVHMAAISAEAEERMRQLMGIQEDAVSAIIQSQIVNSLRFEGMYDRLDTVEDAHLGTFRWILDEGSAGKGDAEQETRRGAASGKFTRWLSAGSGIFTYQGTRVWQVDIDEISG